MCIKAILFDLDGTLLPMDQDLFTKSYFKKLAAKLADRGYRPEELVGAIWSGTASMVKNDGSCTNEEAFWKVMNGIYGEVRVQADVPYFDAFYQTDFDLVREDCGFNPLAAETVAMAKKAGLRVVLATNPLFPACATEARIRWAGLQKEDFEFYTTYEDSRHCKPNPEYYRDLLRVLELDPEECMMVGNDVGEDMIPASELGMKVFLLTDCLINKTNRDPAEFPGGDFKALQEEIQRLLSCS